MKGIKDAAAVNKIKGDFREDRAQQQPQQIPPQVMGVEKALRQKKREDGKGQTAQAGQPLRSWKQGGPHVVAEHQGHSQDMEAPGGDAGIALFVHEKHPFHEIRLQSVHFTIGGRFLPSIFLVDIFQL